MQQESRRRSLFSLQIKKKNSPGRLGDVTQEPDLCSGERDALLLALRGLFGENNEGFGGFSVGEEKSKMPAGQRALTAQQQLEEEEGRVAPGRSCTTEH